MAVVLDARLTLALTGVAVGPPPAPAVGPAGNLRLIISARDAAYDDAEADDEERYGSKVILFTALPVSGAIFDYV